MYQNIFCQVQFTSGIKDAVKCLYAMSSMTFKYKVSKDSWKGI
jgi:hypothetical protein